MVHDLRVDFLVFMFAQTANIRERQSLLEEQWDARERARREGDEPKNNCGGNGGFLGHSEKTSERHNRKRLRASTYSGKLHRRPDERENQDQNGIGKRERSQAPREASNDQVIANTDEQPVNDRQRDGGSQIAPGTDSLNAA